MVGNNKNETEKFFDNFKSKMSEYVYKYKGEINTIIDDLMDDIKKNNIHPVDACKNYADEHDKPFIDIWRNIGIQKMNGEFDRENLLSQNPESISNLKKAVDYADSMKKNGHSLEEAIKISSEKHDISHTDILIGVQSKK